MQAQGSGLTNKYAEGYPGKRYYGGCEHVDKVEQLAIDRARQLFGADYANVQPHSGSSANAAVYLALLNAGDTILGMSLAHGGHLTHGAKVSSSGKLYNAVQYGLDTATGLIDYDEVERLAVEHKPKMIVAGFSAYSKTLDFPRFRAIADKVGAYLFVDMAQAGRGFAVVADEVRNLAHRAQESAQQIQKMIEELQIGAQEAVSTMTESQRYSLESVEIANRAGERLSSVTGRIAEIDGMNQSVATATEEQTAVVDSLNMDITEINTLNQEGVENLQATLRACGELETQAGRLRQLVDSFKI